MDTVIVWVESTGEIQVPSEPFHSTRIKVESVLTPRKSTFPLLLTTHPLVVRMGYNL